MSTIDPEPLACPRCARRYPLDERFCASCGMPLTYSGRIDAESPADERRERARKVKPEYARGDLRQVATAPQQAEAEFIQMLLLEEGIPSTLRRTTWDVPELLAAGPRAVMVPESGFEAAREVLRESELETDAGPRAEAVPSPRSLFVGLAIAIAVVAVLIWIGTTFF